MLHQTISKVLVSVQLISSSSFKLEMIRNKFCWSFILLSSLTLIMHSCKMWFNFDWIISSNVSVQKQSTFMEIRWFCSRWNRSFNYGYSSKLTQQNSKKSKVVLWCKPFVFGKVLWFYSWEYFQTSQNCRF